MKQSVKQIKGKHSVVIRWCFCVAMYEYPNFSVTFKCSPIL